MSTRYGESAIRPQPDKVVQVIADYVHDYKVDSELAWETARLCLIDMISCGLERLRFPECRNLLGPVVEGTIVSNGCIPAIHHCRAKPTLISLLRNQGPWDQLPARPDSRSFQHRFKEEKQWEQVQGNKARAAQMGWQVKRYSALMQSFHREADLRLLEGSSGPRCAAAASASRSSSLSLFLLQRTMSDIDRK
jgi:hypothetical protein